MKKKQIKEIRDKVRMTQKELASHCAVSVRTVQGWEQGKRPSGPAQIILKELAK